MHFLFVCVLTLFFLLDQSGTATLALTVAVMHEIGHLIAMTLLETPPSRLSFHLFGVRLEQSHGLVPAGKEAIILVSGSAVNLLTCGVLLLTTQSSPARDLFAGMHLTIGIINLLPVRGLDGGGLLELALTQRLPLWQGERLTSLIQWVFLLVLTGLISYYILCLGGALTLLLILAYLWLSLLRG